MGEILKCLKFGTDDECPYPDRRAELEKQRAIAEIEKKTKGRLSAKTSNNLESACRKWCLKGGKLCHIAANRRGNQRLGPAVEAREPGDRGSVAVAGFKIEAIEYNTKRSE